MVLLRLAEKRQNRLRPFLLTMHPCPAPRLAAPLPTPAPSSVAGCPALVDCLVCRLLFQLWGADRPGFGSNWSVGWLVGSSAATPVLTHAGVRTQRAAAWGSRPVWAGHLALCGLSPWVLCAMAVSGQQESELGGPRPRKAQAPELPMVAVAILSWLKETRRQEGREKQLVPSCFLPLSICLSHSPQPGSSSWLRFLPPF